MFAPPSYHNYAIPMYSRYGRYVLAVVLGAMTACASFESKMNSWIGYPIQRRLDIPEKGREKLEEVRGPDERGHLIYVFRVEEHCRVFWDVDSEGIVRGWRSEGWACKYYVH